MAERFGYFSALTVALIIDSTLTETQGSIPTDATETDVTYAAIGVGIGVFFAVCFVAIKLYMLNRHMLDNELSDVDSSKRPSARAAEEERLRSRSMTGN